MVITAASTSLEIPIDGLSVETVMKALSFAFVNIAIARIPGVSQEYMGNREL